MKLHDGQKILVLNKFGDAISEGFIHEVTKTEILIKDSSTGTLVSLLRRHIRTTTASEVTLSIIGSEL